MLSIDEAIAHAREVAEDKRADADWKFRHGRLNADDCISCAEEHEQLAEWLEELKAYREKKCNKSVYLASKSVDKIDAVNKGYIDGYNKALDDFIHECDNYCGFYSGKNKSITREDILKIAEQLKERNNE